MAKKGPKKKSGSGSAKKKGSGKRPLLLRVAVLTLTVITLVLLLLALLHRTRDEAATVIPVKRHLPQAEAKLREEPPVRRLPQVRQEPQPELVPPPQPEKATAKTVPRVVSPVSARHAEEYREVGPKKTPPPPPQTRQQPQVAIVVDDLGANLPLLRELIALGHPLTAAILPNVPHVGETVRLAQTAGLEIMLHIPMEPRDYPEVDPGDDPLLVALPPNEIRRRMESYLAVVPQAVGGNNHMGSRFTEDSGGMATVLAVLKERGLYFVDSRTSARSVAYAQAQRLQLRTAERDVFLDNELTVAAIRAQLRLLAAEAVERGHAIGICHPHPETVAALKAELPRFKEEGIAVVPASRLVSAERL